MLEFIILDHFNPTSTNSKIDFTLTFGADDLSLPVVVQLMVGGESV